MADEYTIVKIPNDASDEDAIKIINDNFSKITKRIKEQNINISFLDLLRLDTIWTGTYATDGTGSYNNAAMENRRNNFISTCWNTLANYSGVYIQYTATSV